MNTRIFTAAAVALSVLAGATAAEAGGNKHGFYKPHHGYHYGHGYGYDYPHGYFHVSGHSCKYLYFKARKTGSPYYWKKFNFCISQY